jgi:hypothetical protein
MEDKELRSYMHEEHKLIMRILEIVEYSNLQDLKTINEFLNENGFVTKKELQESDSEVGDLYERMFKEDEQYKELFDGTASQLESL